MLGNMFRTCPSSRSISYILLRTVSSKPILTVQDGMIRDDHLVNGLWALATRSLEIGSSLNWNMNGRVWGLAGWFWATPSNLVWIIFSLWSSDHVPPTMYLFISNIRLNFEPRRRILFESSSASNSISPTRYPVKTTCGGIISGILIISPYYYHHSTINLTYFRVFIFPHPTMYLFKSNMRVLYKRPWRRSHVVFRISYPGYLLFHRTITIIQQSTLFLISQFICFHRVVSSRSIEHCCYVIAVVIWNWNWDWKDDDGEYDAVGLKVCDDIGNDQLRLPA